MRALIRITGFAAALTFSAAAEAQANRCDSVLTVTGHSVHDVRYASTIINYLRKEACEGESTKASFDSGGSIATVIEGLPLEAAGYGNGNFASAEQFCELTEKFSLQDTAWSSFAKTPVAAAINAWQACNRLYTEQVGVEVQTTEELLQISLHRQRENVDFEGLTVSGGELECTAPSRKSTGPKVIPVNHETIFKIRTADDWTITCRRLGIEVEGSTVFPATSVSLRTSRGSLLLPLPADVRLSPSHASVLRAELQTLREALEKSCADSKWVELKDDRYAFPHNLGQRPRIATLWVASDSSGEGATVVDAAYIRDLQRNLYPVGTWLSANESIVTIVGTTHRGRFEHGHEPVEKMNKTPHYRAVVCR